MLLKALKEAARTFRARNDAEPEYPLEFLNEPFHYSLRPGQGIVLVTARD